MDKDLFNFINRHQIYLEGVKHWQNADFMRYVRSLAEGVTALLNKLGVDNLGELAKVALNKLLKQIGDLCNKVLGSFGNEFLLEFRRFTRIDTVLQRSGYAAIVDGLNTTTATIGNLWSRVKNTVAPGLGNTPQAALADFLSRAKVEIQNTLRAQHADAATISEAIVTIVGKVREEFAGSAIGRLWSRGKSFIATAYQHASSIVADFLNGLSAECYMWISVIDNRTSEICRERNGEVFQTGGPVPPAHNHCRSRTIPVACGSAKGEVPSFFKWLSEQDKAFIADVYGVGVSNNFADGTSKASDFLAFRVVNPLTLDEFSTKTNFLLPTAG